ncbi:MAG: class I SAM-dependent methyltransferase [Acidobacteria bacterium]|nr:class I SAM-dependent methyltransferase [Acidobacteriota bacterium]
MTLSSKQEPAAGGSRRAIVSPKLLDMRDCELPEFREIHKEMLEIGLELQPRWFRPLLLRSHRLRSYTGYGHWSRAWEYPWAILAADLPESPGRMVDVGGGGSAFSFYLARRGHDCVVADPSLNEGVGCVYDRERTLYQNFRSMAKKVIFKAARIHSVWGLPESPLGRSVKFVSHLADDLSFPDGYFDRVFCLSVIEHIPREMWAGCVKEFERVLRPGGRLVITQDMTTREANEEVYRRLLSACSLRLQGDPRYSVPLAHEDQQRRHPGQGYETIGLVWQKQP